MTTSFSSRSNAKRAALKALGALAVEAEDFKLARDADGRWAWTGLRDSPADSPSAKSEARHHPQGKGEKRTSESGKASARQGSKQARLIGMLRDKDGATVDEIAAAFDWQRHTVRGAIAGALKKKLGFAVTSEKVERRGRVYRIAA